MINVPWDETDDIPDNEDWSPDNTISVIDESCTERFQDLFE